ncbi:MULTISPECIES: hypothetical protein [Bacillales]|jgi:lysophospholipase L1-like esterase|uniref:SGNH/GDSL hydrolase family protein n=2 Tax=Brevibacillus TaxID=55080 RepID=UPI000E395709|nr:MULTISPECIES: hypothetical protein [Bacillales]MBR8661224.1 hypothetical protein [Brevibacillus sp. NL20B1]REK68256.1 MAG: hypothetical protein DF221_00200 [Brevibacillus sp.]MDT3418224.1 lysophospholipase L1-like esterase [Brevibacillus aydinogluensis]NNV04042.1 hypothetical protein [Brevibacillus sp. MCWH]UFJ60959.1 hypothetical protein IRT44_17180 [Anoxybacillus sediminis]
MKRNVWMIWGVVIFICAVGFPVLRAQTSETPEKAEIQGQQFEQSPNPQSTEKNSGETETKKIETETKQEEPLNGEGITVIGDSVILGVEPYLKEKLPKITVDGKIGRQMSQAQDVVNGLKQQGKLGDHIIIELGTNGPFKKEHLRNLLTSLSDAKQVLLVTTRVPKKWQNQVNPTIKEVASEFSNTKVVDWYAASEGKGNYFYEDGVHLKPDGSKYYASLLIEALQEK